MNLGSRRTLTATLTLMGLGACVLVSSSAHADEPIKATEPTLMAEPGEVVDVVDALDKQNNDPFDLNLSLGLVQSWERGKIKRESMINPDGSLDTSSGFIHNIENVATYKQTTTTLNMRADVGLYQDLGFFLRVPLILADDRSLDDLEGSTKGVNAKFGRVADTATGDPMFRLPFASPTRSGIDYIAVGLRWSIFNQHRDPSKPTWTVEVEGRFGVGEPLRACNANPEKVPTSTDPAANGKLNGQGTYPQCPASTAQGGDGAPINADGRWHRNPGAAGRSPGISRGTNAIRLGMMVSNRYRYVEPYGGFGFMAEFQKRGTEIGDFGDVEGIVTNHPPLQGWLTGGMMVHPWENRAQFQRFTIDLRFNAKYISQGRDYTPLFDALGSSNAASLVATNPAEYRSQLDSSGRPVLDKDGNPISIGNYRKPIGFTGVTDVEAHGSFGGHIGFIVQAAQYIRFNVGLGLTHVQAHLVSASDACNPNFTPTLGDAGRCKAGASSASPRPEVTGAPNPNHRANIDLPGRRFRVSETFIWDAWVSGTVMF